MNYLTFFGNDEFKYKKLLLNKEAKLSGWFDGVIAHSPETISDFLNQHQEFVRENKRGYGYWIWKPYIILDLLKRINEGDTVTYIDSGGSILCHKKNKFDEYLDILKKSERPIIAFGEHSPYLEKQFQKMTILKRFGLDKNENFLNSSHIESGVIICKKTDFTVRFFEEWLALMLENNYSMIHDRDELKQLDCFIENRHDQSLFSILCKSHLVNILSIDDCYGHGAFFSSRTSDREPRKFAPDWCRKEEDYETGKHWNWRMYLKDGNVRNRVIDKVKSLISEVSKTLHFGNIDFDIKQEFTNQIIPILDELQTKKGLHRIELSIDQPHGIAVNKEKVSGQFSCSFVDQNDTISFNFEVTTSGAFFPETPVQYNMFFKSVYTRTWVGVYLM
jgi:hypothetical protein